MTYHVIVRDQHNRFMFETEMEGNPHCGGILLIWKEDTEPLVDGDSILIFPKAEV